MAPYTPKPAQVVTLKGVVVERVLADHRANGTPFTVYAPPARGTKESSAGMVEVEIVIRSK